jgi:uncharacterized membrane protein
MALNVSPAAFAMILVLAGSGAGHAQTEGMERCYGVARAGESDGTDGGGNPGSATVDFQGDAWTWVPEGDCLTMPLPQQTDGTPRRGSLHPLKRDLP